MSIISKPSDVCSQTKTLVLLHHGIVIAGDKADLPLSDVGFVNVKFLSGCIKKTVPDLQAIFYSQAQRTFLTALALHNTYNNAAQNIHTEYTPALSIGQRFDISTISPSLDMVALACHGETIARVLSHFPDIDSLCNQKAYPPEMAIIQSDAQTWHDVLSGGVENEMELYFLNNIKDKNCQEFHVEHLKCKP